MLTQAVTKGYTISGTFEVLNGLCGDEKLVNIDFDGEIATLLFEEPVPSDRVEDVRVEIKKHSV